MRAVGIVAEYNPFHNGHLYHLKKIKEMYKDYVIVVVMNGNFTERGDITIIDKWKRCDIALELGVDLVVELPFSFSTQSADFYAYGAITILEKLGCERVIFGSESDSINDLELIAKTQIDNKDFDLLVKINCRLGYNYPTALSLALKDLTGKSINTPNDLLGISYIKTIIKNNYKIKAECIKRTNDYHDLDNTTDIVSASAIRNSLLNKIDISNNVPDNTLERLNNLHFIDDYFKFLKYKIITDNNLETYQTVDSGFNKILKDAIINCNSYDELIKKVKSKKYTYNKISRMLLHILCSFTKEEALKYKDITYIRPLGFNSMGKKYLNSIKKNIDIPIISKITREKDEMLDKEMQTTKIYELPYDEDLYSLEFKNHLFKEDL